ncbi:hypothetical protein OXPF_36790 [Oxobacter pfennigii]|uniref:Uncharacterized protein n=1 Tax=Oxobacter pfennigii TaxID=36849 RepID=A0A0P8W4Y9_9CLOT|nr:hypothetical protein OXPF_36790 [Oxobacter pfennigii]
MVFPVLPVSNWRVKVDAKYDIILITNTSYKIG